MACHPDRFASRPLRRLLIVSSLVAAMLAVTAPSPAFADGDRDDGVSARTGMQYWGNFNCVGRRPLHVHSAPPRAVEIEIARVVDGDELAVRRDVDPSQSTTLQRVRTSGFAGVNAVYENDTVFILRDRLPGESTWHEVLRFGPSDCQDFDAGTVGTFTSIDPTRAFDSRPSNLVNHTGGKPAAASSISIAAADMPDRPDDVIAVALTVTMASPDGRGFAQAYPTGVVTPGSTASVNTSGPGGAVGNLAVAAVGTDGSVSVYTSTGSHLIIDIVGYFVESPTASAAGGRLEVITSKRLFDTRSGKAVNSNGVKLGPGETRSVDLTALESGLPAGASAAVINVTSTAANAQGYIQVAAGGTLDPGASAVVNLAASETKGGLTIVPLAPDGTIDVYSSAGADAIIDLAGWFTPDTAAADDTGLFVALQPERVVDTRAGGNTTNLYWNQGHVPGVGLYSGVVPLHAILSSASAILVNVTAISPDGPGFIQLSDRSNSDRLTSSVNFTEPGSTVANAAVVAVGQSSGVYLAWPYGPAAAATARNADVALDISGYFTI